MIEMESNKIVHINKLLASKKYGVGKKVGEFIDSFKEDLNKKDCNVKYKMAELMAFVQEIQTILSMEGNLGSHTMRKFLPLARFLSEKYI